MLFTMLMLLNKQLSKEWHRSKHIESITYQSKLFKKFVKNSLKIKATKQAILASCRLFTMLMLLNKQLSKEWHRSKHIESITYQSKLFKKFVKNSLKIKATKQAILASRRLFTMLMLLNKQLSKEWHRSKHIESSLTYWKQLLMKIMKKFVKNSLKIDNIVY